MRKVALNLAAWVVAWMWVGAAHAQTGKLQDPGALCPPCLHDQVLQGLPASIEAVIAINDGARQRASVAGKALAGVIGESGAWAETSRAWRELARTLDWTPERAFDELLGRRISLIARGLLSPDGPDWVVLSAVSGPTQKRLRERLRAAPRGAIAGMSVLSIEDGSFQLVVAPCLEAEGRGEDGSVILLAPRRSEALFDELAPALRGIGVVPVVPAGRPCDVVVSVRQSGDDQRSLSITATALENGWDAALVCAPSYLLDQPLRAADIRPWRDSTFRELEAGAMIAVMSIGAGHGLWFLPDQVRSWMRTLADLAGETVRAGGLLRTGVFVRATGPGPAAQPRLNLASAGQVPDQRSVDAGPRGRLVISVMAETHDSRATLVQGDLAMARLVRALMTGKAELDGAAPAMQFEIMAQGPRLLRVGEDVTVHPDLEPRLIGAFGDMPLLSWNMLDRRRGEAAWWVASMSPGDTGLAREARALAAPETGTARARLSIGTVRPAAVERWIGAIDPELFAPVPGAKFVDSVRWDSWLRDDGRIEATVNVRMVGAGSK